MKKSSIAGLWAEGYSGTFSAGFRYAASGSDHAAVVASNHPLFKTQLGSLEQAEAETHGQLPTLADGSTADL
jgi:hypothetical protein